MFEGRQEVCVRNQVTQYAFPQFCDDRGPRDLLERRAHLGEVSQRVPPALFRGDGRPAILRADRGGRHKAIFPLEDPDARISPEPFAERAAATGVTLVPLQHGSLPLQERAAHAYPSRLPVRSVPGYSH